MATWTSVEVATATLRGMRILGAGQSAEAEDAAVVTDAYNGVYRELRRLGLSPWAQEAVPAEFQQPLRVYIAGTVAEQFGFPTDQARAWKQDGMIGLRQQASGDKKSVPIRAEYY